MRSGRILQRIHGVDERHDAPRGEVRHHHPLELGHDPGLFRHRARAQHRADDGVPLHHQQGEVEFGLQPAHQADHHQPAPRREGLQVALQVGRADVVQHHIHPPPPRERAHGRGELLGRIVHHVVHPHRPHALHLARRAGHDHAHIGNERAAQVDGRRVHPSPAPVQQHRLPVPETAEHEQVQVRGHVGLAHTRRLHPGKRLGDPDQVALAGTRELRVPPAGHERHDPVAGAEALDPGAGLAHHARHLEPQDFGLARGRGVLSFPLADVRPVDGGRHHLDEDLAPSGRGHRRVSPPQNLGSPETVHQYGLHGPSSGGKAASGPTRDRGRDRIRP